jgi:hypothetical protein
MEVPRLLRKQMNEYRKAGFNLVTIEPRSGSHFKVVFKEFSEPQIVSSNGSDHRALKNNIARFRRLAMESKDDQGNLARVASDVQASHSGRSSNARADGGRAPTAEG